MNINTRKTIVRMVLRLLISPALIILTLLLLIELTKEWAFGDEASEEHTKGEIRNLWWYN